MNSGRRAPRGGRPSRGAPAARAASQKPSPAVIIMIILPVLGIAGMGGYLLMNKEQPAESKPDKSTRLDDLVARVDGFEQEEQDVVRRLRAEEPGAQERAEALMDRIGAWLEEWDGVTAELRDAKGRWKEEYSGYSVFATRINKLRQNLYRSMNF
ncbi:MAG: hypothetical protein JXA90_10090 [Planctomycetes bacterium]|nr:hypothetical protein [Planctomycetota bacterium]